MTQKLKQQKNLKKSNERENKSLRTKKKRKQKNSKIIRKVYLKLHSVFFCSEYKEKQNSSDLET